MGPQILKRFYSCPIESPIEGSCLLWQLPGLHPQGTTEGSVYGPVHHCGQASFHPGPRYQAVSEEGPKNGQGLQSPKYGTASGTRVPSLGPKGSLTASTPNA